MKTTVLKCASWQRHVFSACRWRFCRFKAVDTARVHFTAGAGGRKSHGLLPEPLAVAIHATHEAGDLPGQRVFISGVGLSAADC